MKLAHALLQALKDYGATEVFGIPGDFALPFFKEIEASRILPLHTLSHEPAVGFAADYEGYVLEYSDDGLATWTNVDAAPRKVIVIEDVGAPTSRMYRLRKAD